VSEIDGALERASFTYHASLKAMHHPSYTSPYVREHQVGLSSVLSLSPLSFSLYRPVYVCVERERVLVVHTYSLSLLQSYTHRETQTHTISCCSITGRWILFIMALRSCFLLHSMGLARKPAYALSSRNDRLLFVQDYTHAYTRLAGRSFVFFFINYPHFISHYHIYSPKKCTYIYILALQ